MDQKDVLELLKALYEVHKKLYGYEFSSAKLNEAIEDVEHIIDFLETNIED